MGAGGRLDPDWAAAGAPRRPAAGASRATSVSVARDPTARALVARAPAADGRGACGTAVRDADRRHLSAPRPSAGFGLASVPPSPAPAPGRRRLLPDADPALAAAALEVLAALRLDGTVAVLTTARFTQRAATHFAAARRVRLVADPARPPSATLRVRVALLSGPQAPTGQPGRGLRVRDRPGRRGDRPGRQPAQRRPPAQTACKASRKCIELGGVHAWSLLPPVGGGLLARAAPIASGRDTFDLAGRGPGAGPGRP